MDSRGPYSKREVSRAGAHLAARLRELRRGERAALLVDSADEAARQVVEWWRDEHLQPMFEVYDVVRQFAPRVGDTGIRAVSFRPKRFESTIEKLTREPGKLADMVDIGGVRAVADAQEEVDDLHAELGSTLDIRRIRDWARSPRATGYRAVHLHVRAAGRMIEVQLRTSGQDTWANIVEEETRSSGFNYKAGEGPGSVVEFLRLVADLIAVVELGESHPDLPEQMPAVYKAARPLLHTPRLRDLGP